MPVCRSVSAVVIDGVTVGRPCCAVHNCKTPLESNRLRFCPEHAQMEKICAIVGCEALVVNGKKTCLDPIHQEVERIHTERGQAQFQMKARLQRAQVAHPNDSVAQEVDQSEIVDDDMEQAFEVHGEGHI